jgi:acetyltransferase-like isoleucine patch superfamily enzyme
MSQPHRFRPVGNAVVAGHAFGIRLRDKLFSVAASPAFASFGSRSVVQMPVRLGNAGRISIGSGVFIGAGSWLQALEPRGSEPALLIGDGTSIAGYCVFSAAKTIRIGRNVSICRNVYIADHTHEYENWPVPVEEQGITDIEPVEVADGAWLGENVVIFPGVRIGFGAVISANSVVTKDVPDRTLVAGVPARQLRKFGVQDRTGAVEATLA